MKLTRANQLRKPVTDRTPLRMLFHLFGVSIKGHDLQVRAHFAWLLKDAETNYRARMKTLHPDVSGEQEAALILNRAMQRLRAIAARRGVIEGKRIASPAPSIEHIRLQNRLHQQQSRARRKLQANPA